MARRCAVLDWPTWGPNSATTKPQLGHNWATSGPQLGHNWATLGPPLGLFSLCGGLHRAAMRVKLVCPWAAFGKLTRSSNADRSASTRAQQSHAHMRPNCNPISAQLRPKGSRGARAHAQLPRLHPTKEWPSNVFAAAALRPCQHPGRKACNWQRAPSPLHPHPPPKAQMATAASHPTSLATPSPRHRQKNGKALRTATAANAQAMLAATAAQLHLGGGRRLLAPWRAIIFEGGMPLQQRQKLVVRCFLGVGEA